MIVEKMLRFWLLVVLPFVWLLIVAAASKDSVCNQMFRGVLKHVADPEVCRQPHLLLVQSRSFRIYRVAVW